MNTMTPATLFSIISLVVRVLVWGDVSMEGHTDLYRINDSTLTTIRYLNEIFRAIVRSFTGAVGPGFLLVHDNTWSHKVRVCR